MVEFVCIGVPYWLGERLENRSEVYSARDSGIAQEIGAEWVDVSPDFTACDNPVVAVNRALAQTIAAHPDRIPIIFASDCTACIGAVKGLERYKPAVLWYDSHGDFNTPESSPSGFLGGMPLAALVGRGNEHLMQGADLPPVAESDVLFTDGRNLDPEEGVMLFMSDVTVYEDVNDLLTAALPDKPLYIHFDTDVVDSAEMPAMNYPEPNGPTLEETAATVARVARDAQVVGMLFSLWNDTLPGADKALEATLRIVRAFVAGMQ